MANEAPLTVAQKPANNFFGITGFDPGARIGQAGNAFLDLFILKQFQDADDGEFGYQYDPTNGVQIRNTKTAGSAGPRSLWRATDMFWIGGVAGLVLLVVALKHK